MILFLMLRIFKAVLLPVFIAGLVPAAVIILDPWRQPVFAPGLVVAAAGIALAAVCISHFYRRGGGTPAPWDPPETLVTTGPYRFCRNPMYVGVLLVIAGLALLFTSPLTLLYTAVAAAGFHLRVVLYEEPELSRSFGKRWSIYTAATSRWLPKWK